MHVPSKVLASLSVVGLLAVAVSLVVYSAFSSTTSTKDNTIRSGTITLADNDSGSALLTVTGIEPGEAFTRCLKVSHASTGALESNVTLYGATIGALAPHLRLKITRGRDAAPSGTTEAQKLDCSGFSADATDYDGTGPNGTGVLYDDTLALYPDSYDAGLTDPDGAWADGEHAVYQVEVSLPADAADSAQGLSATHELAFQARNN